jgi:hypothetical protein
MTISDDPWRDLDAEREAIAKLALGDMDAFVARAAADVGFPFEPEALDALARLIGLYERLPARLKAETGVRITELEKLLRARRRRTARHASGEF